mgnify:CR=1 FL=1
MRSPLSRMRAITRALPMLRPAHSLGIVRLPAGLDPLGGHPWYKSQPLEKQIEIGLWRQANIMKVGLQFENILIRGIMQYTALQPNNSPEFRYATHEARGENQAELDARIADWTRPQRAADKPLKAGADASPASVRSSRCRCRSDRSARS